MKPLSQRHVWKVTVSYSAFLDTIKFADPLKIQVTVWFSSKISGKPVGRYLHDFMEAIRSVFYLEEFYSNIRATKNHKAVRHFCSVSNKILPVFISWSSAQMIRSRTPKSLLRRRREDGDSVPRKCGTEDFVENFSTCSKCIEKGHFRREEKKNLEKRKLRMVSSKEHPHHRIYPLIPRQTLYLWHAEHCGSLMTTNLM